MIAVRRRGSSAPWAVALLGLVVLGTGCSIKAGNMKEYRERKRQVKEARAQAEAASGDGEAVAAGAEPSGESGASGDAAVPAAAVAGEELLDSDLLGALFLVTRRGADGEIERLYLREPMVGYYEREFLAGGKVQDRQVTRQVFAFHDSVGFEKVKIRKIDRMEILSDGGYERTQVRLRFHFRNARQAPEEFSAEFLRGADHPNPPFLEGIGPKGTVRIPLFAPPDAPDYRPLVEVDFTLEAGS